MNTLPPEIIAAIASGITSLIAFVIRWLEIKLFRAKLKGKDEEVSALQANINELKEKIGRNL